MFFTNGKWGGQGHTICFNAHLHGYKFILQGGKAAIFL
jgi:hypothetical protein